MDDAQVQQLLVELARAREEQAELRRRVADVEAATVRLAEELRAEVRAAAATADDERLADRADAQEAISKVEDKLVNDYSAIGLWIQGLRKATDSMLEAVRAQTASIDALTRQVAEHHAWQRAHEAAAK